MIFNPRANVQPDPKKDPLAFQEYQRTRAAYLSGLAVPPSTGAPQRDPHAPQPVKAGQEEQPPEWCSGATDPEHSDEVHAAIDGHLFHVQRPNPDVNAFVAAALQSLSDEGWTTDELNACAANVRSIGVAQANWYRAREERSC